MEKTPQQNNALNGSSAPEYNANTAPGNQEGKSSAKKIVYETETGVPGLENLPPEASDLIKSILSKDLSIKDTSDHSEKIIMESITGEASLAKVPQMDQQAQDLLRMMLMPGRPVDKPAEKQEIPPMQQAVRPDTPTASIPKPPPPPVSPPPPPPPAAQLIQHKDLIQELIIDEKGAIFGIQINRARKKEVLEIMKVRSKVDNSGKADSTLKYDDIGIQFHFGDEAILQEITFNYPFEGSTARGLRLGDSINRAIQFYGQPKISTGAGAIWDKISLFLNDDTIISIRLRSN